MCYPSLLQIQYDNNSSKTSNEINIFNRMQKTFQKVLKYSNYLFILELLINLTYSLLKIFNILKNLTLRFFFFTLVKTVQPHEKLEASFLEFP